MLVFIKQLQLTGKQLVSLSLSVEKVRKYLLIQRLQKELARTVVVILIKQLQLTGKQLVRTKQLATQDLIYQGQVLVH